jgi:hypothetical protein
MLSEYAEGALDCNNADTNATILRLVPDNVKQTKIRKNNVLRLLTRAEVTAYYLFEIGL